MTRFVPLGGLVLALAFSGAAAQDKKDVPKELAPFQGTWKVVEAVAGGMPEPKDKLPDLQFTFEGEKLIVTEKGKAETGSYAVDAKKDPTAIDLTTPKGDKVPGIYKFDKDGKLTLCFIRMKDATRPKAFDDKGAVLLVLEKVKK
jgi:uncharacterized protein (TIGR03067 family)